MEDTVSKSDDSIRRYEALITVVLTLPLWIIMLWPIRYGFPARLSATDTPEDLWFLIVYPLVGLLSLVVGWLLIRRFGTTIPVFLLGICLCIIVTKVQGITKEMRRRAVLKHSYHRNVRSAQPSLLSGREILSRQETLPIALLDGPVEVEALSVDGVALGKLPCEISLAKLRKTHPNFFASLAQQVSSTHFSPFQVALEINHRPKVDAKVFTKLKDGKYHLSLVASSIKGDAQIKDLIDWARLNGYETSPQWCEAFFSFGRHGWAALQQLTDEEPEISGLLDDLAKYRYGIVDKMNSAQAWNVLMKISDEAKEKRSYFSNSWPEADSKMPETAYSCAGRAVTLLAPQLDHQQVADALTAAIKRGQWDTPMQIGARVFPITSPIGGSYAKRCFEIMPVIHAAWEIDRALNREDPEQYNLIERQVGNALFRHTQPSPRPYYYRDLLKLLEGSEQGKSNLSSSPGNLSYIARTEFPSSLFGSPLSDEYLLRHWQARGAKFINHALGDHHLASKTAVQTGLSLRVNDGAAFGNIKINQWHKKLINLDSPTGRDFRRTHRQELLQLAIRSLGPIEQKETKIEDREMRLVMGALTASVPSLSGGSGKYPIINHLEFLMLDAPGTKEQPSLAMEFWPFFDAMLDTFPKVGDHIRLRSRWDYLGRLWPESNEDSFVEAYLKTSSLARQEVLIGINLKNHGLPDILPLDTRLKILKRIKDEVEKLPDSKKETFSSLYLNRRISEESSIEHAIARLDCPEGGATYMRLNAKYFVKDVKPHLGPDLHSSKYLYRLMDLLQFRLHYPKRFARDDRVDACARHEDPDFRLMAVAVIRHVPKPRYVRLLAELTNDSEPFVRAEAIKVKERLDEIRKGNWEPRSLIGPLTDPNTNE